MTQLPTLDKNSGATQSGSAILPLRTRTLEQTDALLAIDNDSGMDLDLRYVPILLQECPN